MADSGQCGVQSHCHTAASAVVCRPPRLKYIMIPDDRGCKFATTVPSTTEAMCLPTVQDHHRMCHAPSRLWSVPPERTTRACQVAYISEEMLQDETGIQHWHSYIVLH